MKKLFIFMIVAFLSGNVYGVIYKYSATDFVVVDGKIVETPTAVIFVNNATISFTFNLSGRAQITIRAREDYLPDEHALLKIETPSTTEMIRVTSSEWRNYDFIAQLTSGKWFLSFVNDKTDAARKLDRNLYLDYIEIEMMESVPRADGPLVKLTWNPNTEDDLAGYKIHFGMASRQYDHQFNIGNDTEYTVLGLDYDTHYYFAATAYDSAGNESGYSNEVDTLLQSEPPQTVLIGDCNGDGAVDHIDMIRFGNAYGATETDAQFNECFDFNLNREIDIFDMTEFGKHYGETILTLK